MVSLVLVLSLATTCFTNALPVARQAVATYPVGGSPNGEVISSQAVTPFAMGLPRISGCWVVASQNSFGYREANQVIGIDASAIPALGRYNMLFVDRSVKLSVEPPGSPFAAIFGVKGRVAISIKSTEPKMAAVSRAGFRVSPEAQFVGEGRSPHWVARLPAPSALATCPLLPIGVFRSEAVAVRAVGLRGLDAALHVLVMSDGLQMLWIDTGAITAEMVEFQSVCYRPGHEFIDDAMRHCTPDSPIAVGVSLADPEEASLGPLLGLSADDDRQAFHNPHGNAWSRMCQH